MTFHATKLPGVYVIELEPRIDERGSFARTYCQKEFAERGLCTEWVQTSTSFNLRRGTLRGMHYQASPHEEIKLVRCTRGAIFDVALDLRQDSPAYGKWFSVELTAQCNKMVYIPKGVAHGFQTLVDATEILYQISTPYVPDAARGVQWNDPVFGISWPKVDSLLISPKDASYLDTQ